MFVWSATTVYIRNVHSKLDVLSFSAIQMLLGGLMMTGVGLAIGEAGEWTWSKPGLIAMAYLTIASSCLAYTAFAWLAKNTTPAMVGTYSYVNPAIAAILGWWFLDEQLGREPAHRHGDHVRGRRARELAAEGCEAARRG